MYKINSGHDCIPEVSTGGHKVHQLGDVHKTGGNVTFYIFHPHYTTVSLVSCCLSSPEKLLFVLFR